MLKSDLHTTNPGFHSGKYKETSKSNSDSKSDTSDEAVKTQQPPKKSMLQKLVGVFKKKPAAGQLANDDSKTFKKPAEVETEHVEAQEGKEIEKMGERIKEVEKKDHDKKEEEDEKDECDE
ncbi:unnamed protein product, partial [Mesorhabditis spiculigera]